MFSLLLFVSASSVPEAVLFLIFETFFTPQIYLMPPSLARKRVWNKKYPICIELAKQDDFMSKAQGEKSEAGEDKSTGLGEKVERPERTERPESSALAEEPKRPTCGRADQTIYLFGRTGREKEEWFHRFLQASQMKSEGRGGGLSATICKGELYTPSQLGWNIWGFCSRFYLQKISILWSSVQPSDLCLSLSLGTANPFH